MHPPITVPNTTMSGWSLTRWTIASLIFCLVPVVYAGTHSGLMAAATYPSSNVRHKQCIGTRGNGVDFDVNQNWGGAEYDRVIGPIASATPSAFDTSVRPCIMKKITWREFYTNTSLAPETPAQAQDPNWENYRWNDVDTLGIILNDPKLQRADALVALLVADQSSAQKNSPPKWYIDAGHTYGNAAQKRYRNRLDSKVAVNHLADFYIALLARYGGHPRLHSLVLGEYFSGPAKSRPDDMDLKKYYQGRRALWATIINHAPLDDNGNRLAIYQTNPVLRGGVSTADLERIMIGVSYSDIALFEDGCGEPGASTCKVNSMSWIAQQLYGKVPLMLNGDDRVVRRNRKFAWTGIANPFNLEKGHSGLVTPQQLFWYHGSRGVLPIDSLFLKIANNYPQNAENLADAVSQFAPGGSMSTDWGVLPARTPGTGHMLHSYPTQRSAAPAQNNGG